jgi:hypothetical protein
VKRVLLGISGEPQREGSSQRSSDRTALDLDALDDEACYIWSIIPSVSVPKKMGLKVVHARELREKEVAEF